MKMLRHQNRSAIPDTLFRNMINFPFLYDIVKFLCIASVLFFVFFSSAHPFTTKLQGFRDPSGFDLTSEKLTPYMK